MSCVLYSKGAYIKLQAESRLIRDLASDTFQQPLAEFLFELNADAYAVRYGHHGDNLAEIEQARQNTDSDYEFELTDWNDPAELFNLLKRIEYQCSDILTSEDPENPRYLSLVAMREECERRMAHPIYLAEAKRKREIAQAEAAIVKANDKERMIKELRAKYPWAKEPNCTKNLKKELILAFPGVKFSVRMRHHGSIIIAWADGPTGAQVDAIANKYESGSFDGMTDCYQYDHSAQGEAVSVVLGHARYINGSRSFSDGGLFERVCRDLAELQGVPFTSTWQRRDGDTLGLDDYAHKALARVSFPPGAVYVGVDYSEKITITGSCLNGEQYKIVHSMTDQVEDLRVVVKAEFDYIARQQQRRAM